MKKYRAIFLPIILMIAVSCAYDKGVFPKINNAPGESSSVKEENARSIGGGWFEAVGKASYANITPEEARRKAIINACINAIQYSGFEVSQRNLDVQVESNHQVIQNDFLSLTSLTTNGVILDKVIVHEEVVKNGENVDKVVRLRVKIGKQKGEKDPYFSIKASLNRDVFKVGETLRVSVTSTQDCYLTILDISDDVVYVLLPNKYCADGFVRKGDNFAFPSNSQEKMGITIPAILPSGKSIDMGVIKILATKKEYAFESQCGQSQYGTYELALHDLLKYIITLPRNEMEEADLTYKITK